MRRNVKSYKQLPINLFQIQTKFRDEIRPRFGLMRGREFTMKDAYSFHVDDADADREYWRMFEAYKRIFTRLGVNFRPVEADSGAIGGSFTHEFHVLAGSGEDAILSCSACEYTSNAEKTEAPGIPFAYATSPCMDAQAGAFSHARHRADGGAGKGVQGCRAQWTASRPRLEVLSLSSDERLPKRGT